MPPTPAPQAVTTADRAEQARVAKQEARAAQREAEDREAKAAAAATAAAEAATAAKAEAEAKPLVEIREQLAQVQAQADARSFTHNAKISEASPSDYTDRVDGKILANNGKLFAVQKGREIKIFKIAEVEKSIVYTGADKGPGRFAKGNEFEIKKAHKTDEMRAYVRERREEMKSEQQKKKEKERGI